MGTVGVIGTTFDWKGREGQQVYDTLGPRVWSDMAEENRGPQHVRIGQIVKRSHRWANRVRRHGLAR
jgi:hypothetical protein